MYMLVVIFIKSNEVLFEGLGYATL